MDRSSNVFGNLMYSPKTTERSYLESRSAIFGTDDFVGRPLPGQLMHAAFALQNPIQLDSGMELSARSLLVAGVWDSRQAFQQAFGDRIEPALAQSGIQAKPLEAELLAALCNPEVSRLSRNACYARIELWPALTIAPDQLYYEVMAEIFPEGRSFPPGSGTHCAYIVEGQLLTLATWRGRREHDSFFDHELTDAVAQVYKNHHITDTAQPEVISAQSIGLNADGELRYIASTN